VLLPPGAPALTDKASIHAFWQEFLKSIQTIYWQHDRLEVASSGDVAWESGHWTTTAKGLRGSVITAHGKFAEVWKKQSDGSWKCSLDVFNDDKPTPAPPAK
jgi:ketosteroid isomerase-like protein